jgi:hypothetical protein
MMEIENLFRYTALAVGLKPSASQGEARLRGLYRIISSKTIISVYAGAAWERGRPARVQPHRGGKSASGRPHAPFAPCRSIAARPQSRATEMNFGLRWRRLGARSSRPRAALQRRDFREAPARHLPFQTSGRPARPLRPVWEHCGATAIAGDRNEFRSTLAPPGSAGELRLA